MLFWSDKLKQWEAPKPKSAQTGSAKPTEFPCPVCKERLEEYPYQKDGQAKVLLRCSSPKARTDKKHKDVVYYQTPKGWWSLKLEDLKVTTSPIGDGE